jgi:hypothetical protein
MTQSGTEQERDLLEELASVSAADVVAEACLSLIALAQVRLGIPPERHERFRDLEAARLLIDAFGGMLGAVEGRMGAAEPRLRDALAGLRLAYAEVAAHTQGGHAPAGAAAPEEAARPARQPGEGVQRPSGLWVPGRD